MYCLSIKEEVESSPTCLMDRILFTLDSRDCSLQCQFSAFCTFHPLECTSSEEWRTFPLSSLFWPYRLLSGYLTFSWEQYDIGLVFFSLRKVSSKGAPHMGTKCCSYRSKTYEHQTPFYLLLVLRMKISMITVFYQESNPAVCLSEC